MVQSLSFWVRWPGFKSHFCYFLSIGKFLFCFVFWSRSLSFLICRMGLLPWVVIRI